jgi:hypothetical protein
MNTYAITELQDIEGLTLGLGLDALAYFKHKINTGYKQFRFVSGLDVLDASYCYFSGLWVIQSTLVDHSPVFLFENGQLLNQLGL